MKTKLLVCAIVATLVTPAFADEHSSRLQSAIDKAKALLNKATHHDSAAKQKPATPSQTKTTDAAKVAPTSPQTATTTTSQAKTPATATSSTAINTAVDKLSYTIGVDMGENFKAQNIQVSPEMLMHGLKDAISGSTLKMNKTDMEMTLKTFQQQLLAKREAAFNTLANKNQQAGTTFLNTNKTKQGVVTLPSGLQYKVVTAGTGAKPTGQDMVTVEYTGKLINGMVFDKTEPNKPVTFKVSDVIQGWSQALQMMKAGAQWELYIPSSLAYGQRGLGGPIGPNETLIFNVHLVSVKKGGVPTTGGAIGTTTTTKIQ